MRKYILIFICVFAYHPFMAQEVPDSLKIEKDGWSYYQNDYLLRISDLMQITADNEDANYYIRAARTNHILSAIIGSVGGGLIGYQLGKFLYSRNMNMVSLIIGGALVCISIPLSVGYYDNLKKGVDAYNTG